MDGDDDDDDDDDDHDLSVADFTKLMGYFCCDGGVSACGEWSHDGTPWDDEDDYMNLEGTCYETCPDGEFSPCDVRDCFSSCDPCITDYIEDICANPDAVLNFESYCDFFNPCTVVSNAKVRPSVRPALSPQI